MREIERKFLVKELPGNLDQYPHRDLQQGYLLSGPKGVEVRVRREGEQQWLTVKEKLPDGSREEHNFPLTTAQWEELWAKTAGRRLSKTRYEVPFGVLTVEIDVYTGSNQGLVVAEVEFPDLETARSFQSPDWLGEDVTGNPRYSNPLLATE